ncbi:MAG: ATP-binding cassette domain-containing protein [Eubacteriales bacterium]
MTCEQLSVGYDGRAVLREVSFALPSGAYLCVLGDSGSGKTSLLHAILGFLPPLAGTVRLGEGVRRQHIGYLPAPNMPGRSFPFSVWEVVLSGSTRRFGRGLFVGREAKAYTKQQLTHFGLAPLARRPFRELSGGQQQLVLLARAVCAAEGLLLLDEPLAGLDPYASQIFTRLVREVHRTEGMTVVAAATDASLPLADATHVLDLGTFPAFFGSAESYRSR